MNYQSHWSFWYLCGVAEDVYVRTDSSKGYEFDLDSVSLEWVKVIKPIIERLIEKEVSIRPHTNRPHFRLRFFHKELVTAIKSIKDNPDQIRCVDATFQAQWIAGFFDAEGSVTRTGTNQPMLSIYSINTEKITLLKELFAQFSIHSGLYLPRDRKVYQLYLTGKANIQKFVKVIPIRHPAKIARIRGLDVY